MKKRVNLAWHNLKIDIIVRHDTRVAFGDPDQFQSWRIRHIGPSHFRCSGGLDVTPSDVVDRHQYRLGCRRGIKARHMAMVDDP